MNWWFRGFIRAVACLAGITVFVYLNRIYEWFGPGIKVGQYTNDYKATALGIVLSIWYLTGQFLPKTDIQKAKNQLEDYKKKLKDE